MIRYVKTIDELVDLIDREFSGPNEACPICGHSIGTVDIPDVELGLKELKFTQFKYPGVYCTGGHCIISMEKDEPKDRKEPGKEGMHRIQIEDIGVKVFEVMKLLKPYLKVEESVSNAQLYWMLMDRSKPTFLKELTYDEACNLVDRLQPLGARARIV